MNVPATLSPNSPSVAVRFALMMDGLGRVIAARIGHYPITAPMIVYIWNRLNRINQQFQALAALIVAGKLPAERAAPRRGARDTAADPPRAGETTRRWDPWAVWRLLPQRRPGWLCWVAPSRPGSFGAAPYGEQLRRLLEDPEMMALLAATPRVEKLLRPLCWALGNRDLLPRPRRPARPMVVLEAPGGPGDSATDAIASVPTGCGGTGPGAGAARKKRPARWPRPRGMGAMDPCLVAFSRTGDRHVFARPFHYDNVIKCAFRRNPWFVARPLPRPLPQGEGRRKNRVRRTKSVAVVCWNCRSKLRLLARPLPRP